MAWDATRWTNDSIILFHGTTAQRAEGILARDVDLSLSRRTLDFGAGFYATTSLRQAWDWADQQPALSNLEPAVIAFSVDRDALSRLDSLWFVRSDPDAEDFWNFVSFNRGGGASHGRSAFYDVVVGPVTRGGPSRRSVLAHSDQVSFHTQAAIALLTDRIRWMQR